MAFIYRFSKTQMLPHTGFVYYASIVQETTPVSSKTHANQSFGLYKTPFPMPPVSDTMFSLVYDVGLATESGSDGGG